MRRVVAACFAWLAMGASAAEADDDRLRLFGDPISYTDVIDAFDAEDPFDLNAYVGFERTLGSGTIQRESGSTSSSGSDFNDIADYEQVRNTLVLGMDIGLYKDLAVFARLPVILSDDRTLSVPSGESADSVNANLTVPGGDQLFSVPFTSPTRFGVDYIAIGAAYSIFNQSRNRSVPTWLVMVESQIAIGAPMHPCFSDKPETATSRCYGGSEPGVGQGVHALKFETRASHRFRFVEPYAGFAFLYRWPGSSQELFTSGGDLDGYVHRRPPSEGQLTLGAGVIPWEARDRAQRLTLDFRFRGDFVSEGHGYTALTDALGTSQSASLRTPVSECPTCGAQDTFLGLTDTQSHARLGGRFAVEMQAAKYVRFVLGANIAYATPYLLTQADACNADAGDAADPRVGACRSGIVNPHHRAVIDSPGQRFRMLNELTLDLFASAVAQF
ncbi:MAG: hypothetical protein KC417_15610 [Myxococcales bacterium]|nr:hypothetical protein [Myxococcales bacterium]